MADYRYSRYHYKPKRRKRKIFLTFFILILIAGGSVYSIFFVDFYALYIKGLSLYRLAFNDYRFLEKNLEEGNYNVAVHEGLPYLEKKPYNPRLLRYMGESYYFISTSLTGREKEEALDSAIQYLRKGIALTQTEQVLANTYHVLGMSYFNKGETYYELAAEYVQKAVDQGYTTDESSEILGYCYYKLGDMDRAVTHLEKSVQQAPTDVARLYLAYAYRDKEMYESAERELTYLIEHTQDDFILEQASQTKVWIDFQEERYEEAREGIRKIMERNDASAFAHYWLGNIHEREGDLISARKEWRLALRINPNHIGAIEKLY
jgi:tetratricopeptide (TPR) repeat protein